MWEQPSDQSVCVVTERQTELGSVCVCVSERDRGGRRGGVWNG